jgi:hypothetical protein
MRRDTTASTGEGWRMRKASVVAVIVGLVGVALPASAYACGEDQAQVAELVDGRWILEEGPLAGLAFDGDALTWDALPGSTVESVAVETGEVVSGGAAVSAAVLVPGGESGSVPDLAGSHRIVFRGVAECDIAVELLEVERLSGWDPEAEPDQVPAAAVVEAARPRAVAPDPKPEPPRYRPWWGRVR